MSPRSAKEMKKYFSQAVIALCLAGMLSVPWGLIAEKSSPHDAGVLEFRAVITTPSGPWFSLHDPARKLQFWMELGQVRHGIEAVAFDSQTNTLSVRQDGSLQTLHLSQFKIFPQTEPSPKLREGVFALEELDVGELEDMIKADERRYELEAFVGRWRTAAAESAELREFESEIVRLTREGSELLTERRQYEEGSHEHRNLTEKGMDIGRQMTTLVRRVEAILGENPAFSEGDVDLFRDRSGFGTKTGSNVVNLSVKAGRYSVEVPWFEDRQSEK